MFPSYWPNEEGTPLTFGHLTINLVYTIEEDGIRQREFTITSSKTVTIVTGNNGSSIILLVYIISSVVVMVGL